MFVLSFSARGDFEDGYVRGFRDANKLGSASAARGFMHDEYGSRDDRFHEGYVKGLRSVLYSIFFGFLLLFNVCNLTEDRGTEKY